MPVPTKSKIREGSPNGTRKTMEESTCEIDEFLVSNKRSGSDR